MAPLWPRCRAPRRSSRRPPRLKSLQEEGRESAGERVREGARIGLYLSERSGVAELVIAEEGRNGREAKNKRGLGKFLSNVDTPDFEF